ncbi:Cyclin [Brachionus plicatilis]|uniref:Cyclin n=1 Tax=Brachionus plicatilis TaxID=10195 RepID=A0A3M7SVM6_BRAPC|nr:Cyclin [Brachionus plicatilis]
MPSLFLLMLETFNWQISPVTSYTWLMTYLQIAAINYYTLSGDFQEVARHREHNMLIVMPLNVYKNSSSNPS